MEKFAAHVRNGMYGLAFATVKHFPLHVRELTRAVVDVIPHRRVHMREKYLKQGVRRNSRATVDGQFSLEKLLQVVERGNELVSHRHDKVVADDEVNFLTPRFVVISAGDREVEHQKCSAQIARDERDGGRGEKLGANALANRELSHHLPNLVLARQL